MRWVLLLLFVGTALGCRSQSTPLTNPFLAPDRVPPPATRTLAPGTAQPYYPGDVMSGAPAATAPGAAAPGTVFQPASTPTSPYTVPPTTPPLQSAPVTPPGGWSQPATTSPYGVQPTSGTVPLNSSSTENSVVRISPDDQSLRFAAVPNNNPNDILQVAANQQVATTPPYIYTPPTPVVPNAVQPVQFASTSVTGAASDGFRPQGSGQQSQSTPIVQQPVPTSNSGLPQEDANLFGFDATYSWLRGQLQYYPESGQWGLRYISLRGAPDTYGGVAVISNPEVLAGVQPGEYLLLQGFLETEDNFDGTFVPLYTIEGIQRQR